MRRLILIVTILAGCGSNAGLGERLADYRAATTSLNVAIDVHASDPAALAPATCMAAMTDYGGQALATIARMRAMSGGMDQCMGAIGAGGPADFSAGCAAMQDELDAHVRSGCAAANLAVEMARHASAMKALTGQEMAGTDALSGMMNRRPMMSTTPGCD